MKYDLIISDYDYTLADGNYIPSETVEAIRDYISRGGKFAICTGRYHKMMEFICKKYGIDAISACAQGSVIVNSTTGEKIFSKGLDKPLFVEIVRSLLKEGYNPVVYTDRAVCYKYESDYFNIYDGVDGIERLKVENLPEFIEKEDLTVYKMCVKTKSEEFLAVVDKYKKAYGDKFLVNYGFVDYMEIANPDADKNHAVKFIADYYKIPHERVLAVGDSGNDIPLLSGNWHGVAVGNATDELKKVADEITVPFKNQPIKYLIEKYCK